MSKDDREANSANQREGMKRRTLLLSTTSLVAASAISATAPSAEAQQVEEILPKPEPPFRGKIGRTVKDSTPDFPKEVEAPAGAPNVLLILTDDVGFGASSTFGGPIQTPTFQRLADSGLRYNMYHTTALCSPTRAALITGRNHHSVANGVITEFATGYPGYNSLVPKSTGSVGAVLKDNGYNTAWFGKMHNVPDWMSSQAGPFDLWPTGLGFEHFYGFWAVTATNGTPRYTTAPIQSSRISATRITSSTATSRTRRLTGCGCSTRWHPTSRGCCITRPALRTHRTTRPRIGSRSTKGNSTRAGTRSVRRR